MKLTNTQIENIRHTLGLSRGKRPYRNHYNSDNNESWNELVVLGLALKKTVQQCAGDYMYVISNKGFEFIQANSVLFGFDKRYSKMRVDRLRKKFEV